MARPRPTDHGVPTGLPSGRTVVRGVHGARQATTLVIVAQAWSVARPSSPRWRRSCQRPPGHVGSGAERRLPGDTSSRQGSGRSRSRHGCRWSSPSRRRRLPHDEPNAGSSDRCRLRVAAAHSNSPAPIPGPGSASPRRHARGVVDSAQSLRGRVRFPTGGRVPRQRDEPTSGTAAAEPAARCRSEARRKPGRPEPTVQSG
jgi:hypothetical protein